MIEAALEGGFPFFDTAQKLGSGGLLALKSGCSVLEKLSLPLIKYRRVDLVLLAQIETVSPSIRCSRRIATFCSGLK
jgi:hypothetical protein